jgi:hypothetical protein
MRDFKTKSVEEQARIEREKAEFERRKQQDFEEMLQGKIRQRERWTLKGLFKST